MPRLIFQEDVFIFKTDYHNRHIPKESGFSWDPDYKFWYTPHVGQAARLRDFADDTAKEMIDRVIIRALPWDEKLAPPPEGLTYLLFQKHAAAFSLMRNRSYLGLDPGLGKTIVACLIAETSKKSVLYICPPFLVRNVQNEFEKWCSPEIFEKLMILPDSLLTKEYARDLVKSEDKKLLIVDEAHRFKNGEAKRTQALLGTVKRDKIIPGIVDSFDHHVFMSGTPMPNRPMELFPILSRMAPQTIQFMNRFQYGTKFCAGHRNNFGWDFSGASNVETLVKSVVHPTGPFMLRMRKDMIKLPPKIEEVFVFSDNLPGELVVMEGDLGARYKNAEDLIKSKLTEIEGKDDLHTATYRRLLGKHKVPPAVEYIQSILEETEESILVFAHHKEVIKTLEEQLKAYTPYVITGETPMNERHEKVEAFQKDKIRVFIGNYLSMGVGFTLTKATRVVFVEFDWVPGNNDQASDRAHRIGQNESVYVQYLVYQDSLDKAVIESLLRKRKTIQQL